MSQCKLVWQAVKRVKVKWWDTNGAAMEEDSRQCRQGEFFKKLKRLSGSKTRPVDTILDEAGQPLQSNKDKLACWRRHFKNLLNSIGRCYNFIAKLRYITLVAETIISHRQ